MVICFVFLECWYAFTARYMLLRQSLNQRAYTVCIYSWQFWQTFARCLNQTLQNFQASQILKEMIIVVTLPSSHPSLSGPIHFTNRRHQVQHNHLPAVPLLMWAAARKGGPLHLQVSPPALSPVHQLPNPALAQMVADPLGPAQWQQW